MRRSNHNSGVPPDPRFHFDQNRQMHQNNQMAWQPRSTSSTFHTEQSYTVQQRPFVPMAYPNMEGEGLMPSSMAMKPTSSNYVTREQYNKTDFRNQSLPGRHIPNSFEENGHTSQSDSSSSLRGNIHCQMPTNMAMEGRNYSAIRGRFQDRVSSGTYVSTSFPDMTGNGFLPRSVSSNRNSHNQLPSNVVVQENLVNSGTRGNHGGRSNIGGGIRSRSNSYFPLNSNTCCQVPSQVAMRALNKTKIREEYRERSPSRGQSRNWASSGRNIGPLPDRFLLMSYNILADTNAWKHKELYPWTRDENLEWKNRKELICQEIISWKPDMMCLQEVDRFDDLVEDFGKQGYSGIFKGRTGESEDGCAIFWKSNLFRLLEEDNIEFQEHGLRHNVAQLCVFELSGKSKQKRIIIANTHLLFNPKRGDIKLGQVRILLNELNLLSKRWEDAAVVIAGDFNSTPQSALYRYIATSELNLQEHGCMEISGQLEDKKVFHSRNRRWKWREEDLKNATGDSGCTTLRSPIKLFSAYAGVQTPNRSMDAFGEPLVTTYHSQFMGTVDYIWHSEDLVPLRILDMLPFHVLRRMRGLPTNKLGSDHFSLVCEFALTTK